MRSNYADIFNHDEDALDYDEDVLNESDPIRTGYDAALDWVAEQARVTGHSRVLELGSGTGNLTARLPDCHEIVCVDVSEKMEALSRKKVAHFSNRHFIKDNILAIFERKLGRFDAIVSTYAIHNLTESEKGHLFECLWTCLNEKGVAVVGDLMVEDEKDLETKIRSYGSAGHTEVVAALKEEFFWRLKNSIRELAHFGL